MNLNSTRQLPQLSSPTPAVSPAMSKRDLQEAVDLVSLGFHKLATKKKQGARSKVAPSAAAGGGSSSGDVIDSSPRLSSASESEDDGDLVEALVGRVKRPPVPVLRSAEELAEIQHRLAGDRGAVSSPRPGLALDAAQASATLQGFGQVVFSCLIEEFVRGDKQRGLLHGDDCHVVLRGGIVYQGAFEYGQMHDVSERGARMTWPDGTVYEGPVLKQAITTNEARPEGRYTWPDGSTYRGGVRDGVRHGYGVYEHPSAGVSYRGEWKGGLRHGEGTCYYDESMVSFYRGQWVRGVRQGRGTMRYASGNEYSGEWLEDKKHGRGTMVWKTKQQIYEGEWQHDVPHGQGRSEWLDVAGLNSRSTHLQTTNRYAGDFFDGMRHGVGTFCYASGAVYHGMWSSNAKQGQGTYVDENGAMVSGEFDGDRALWSKRDDIDKRSFERLFLSIADICHGTEEQQAVVDVILRFIVELRELYRKYAAIRIEDDAQERAPAPTVSESRSSVGDGEGKEEDGDDGSGDDDGSASDSDSGSDSDSDSGSDSDMPGDRFVADAREGVNRVALHLGKLWVMMKRAGLATPRLSLAVIDRLALHQVFNSPEHPLSQFAAQELRHAHQNTAVVFLWQFLETVVRIAHAKYIVDGDRPDGAEDVEEPGLNECVTWLITGHLTHLLRIDVPAQDMQPSDMPDFVKALQAKHRNGLVAAFQQMANSASVPHLDHIKDETVLVRDALRLLKTKGLIGEHLSVPTAAQAVMHGYTLDSSPVADQLESELTVQQFVKGAVRCGLLHAGSREVVPKREEEEEEEEEETQEEVVHEQEAQEEEEVQEEELHEQEELHEEQHQDQQTPGDINEAAFAQRLDAFLSTLCS